MKHSTGKRCENMLLLQPAFFFVAQLAISVEISHTEVVRYVVKCFPAAIRSPLTIVVTLIQV